MANIRDLKPSLLILDAAEQWDLIKELRSLRRMLKPKPVRKPAKKKAAKKSAKKLTIDQIYAKMNPEQQKNLLRKLKEKQNAGKV